MAPVEPQATGTVKVKISQVAYFDNTSEKERKALLEVEEQAN